jgi:hypothetical protein
LLKQIKLVQRFVSSFIYKTDTTFNTNSLKLLLSVIISINNTKATFLIAYYYMIVTITCYAWRPEDAIGLIEGSLDWGIAIGRNLG